MTTCLRSWKLPLKHKIGPSVRMQSSPLLLHQIGNPCQNRKTQSSVLRSAYFSTGSSSYDINFSGDKKTLCNKSVMQTCQRCDGIQIRNVFTQCNLTVQEQMEDWDWFSKVLQDAKENSDQDDKACEKEQCERNVKDSLEGKQQLCSLDIPDNLISLFEPAMNLSVSICTFDPKNLPSFPSLEDHYHLETGRNVENGDVESWSKIPVTVFSGYLESDHYHVYCIGEAGSKLRQLLGNSSFSDLERQSILWANTSSSQKSQTPQSNGLPSKEQLQEMHRRLSESLPNLFRSVHDYSMYNQNIEFINRFYGVTTKGMAGYIQQLTIIKVLAHLCYAQVTMKILKITYHPEDGTVKVRWRIIGISGLRALFFFWKFRIWHWREMGTPNEEWTDGFSVFDVGSDGLIYRHICDKAIPDTGHEPKTSMVTKIALALGLTSRPEPSPPDIPATSNF